MNSDSLGVQHPTSVPDREVATGTGLQPTRTRYTCELKAQSIALLASCLTPGLRMDRFYWVGDFKTAC